MALRVLMLGWEFPPQISGGLGLACKEIAENLATMCDLTLVVPFSAEAKKPEHYKLVGFDEPVTFFREKRIVNQTWGKKIIRIPTDIASAYSHSYSPSVNNSTIEEQGGTHREEFPSSRLYSKNLFDQIQEYTQDVLRYINPVDFDVVYAHDWMTFLAAQELQKLGLKFVAHIHSLTYDRVGYQDNGWIYQIEKSGLNAADNVITVSHYTGRVCVQHYAVDYKKVNVIHNAFNFLKNEQKEVKNLKHVAFIGRLTSQKAPSTFLQIAHELVKINQQFKFTVIGEGDERELLRKEVAKLGISDHVNFLGFIEHSNVEKALSDAGIYCMPSISEPFGLSALEAVQYGLLPVLSKQSGVAEVLKSAIKIDYWHIDEFVRCIRKYSSDKNMVSELVGKCQSELEDSSWSHTAQGILNVMLDN